MALRIKNHWFKAETPKLPGQTASVMAFITWRTMQNMVKQMREARFDIDVGPAYFAFMRESLGFLIQLVDRMAYLRMTEEARTEFMVALVQRVAEILEESELEWLGAPEIGKGCWRDQFIDLYNELAECYSDFGFDRAGPDFGFVRYFGSRVEDILPGKDRTWVKDQLMAREVPDALAILERGLNGVLSSEPRPSRMSSRGGE